MKVVPALRNYGLSKLARACRVSPQAVQGWLRRGVPAGRVLDIERITGGAVSRHDLRPDLFGKAE